MDPLNLILVGFLGVRFAVEWRIKLSPSETRYNYARNLKFDT